jgi:cation:H+ antiporter
MGILPDSIFVHLIVLGVCFLILSKSADLLVDGAVSIAHHLNVPKMVIGVVLVGFATTAPEFTVSLLSALRGYPEIALGNAVGSVIVDDALALALGIVVAPEVIRIDKRNLRRFGIVLLAVDFLAFGLSLNGILSRLEGLLLLALLVLYLAWIVMGERKDRKLNISGDVETHLKAGGLALQLVRFGVGVAGVIVASEFLIDSAVFIAAYFGASKAVIGLTVVAIGTSIPEIVTCIVAARKGHGDLAFGDIIGADILNVLWIIGTASLASPIVVDRSIILFAFPWMVGVVALMLLLARFGYTLKPWKGYLLMAVYVVYLGHTLLRYYG